MQVLHAGREGRDVAQRRRSREPCSLGADETPQISVRAEFEHDAHVRRIEHRREEHDHRRVAQLGAHVELAQACIDLLLVCDAVRVDGAVQLLHGDLRTRRVAG